MINKQMKNIIVLADFPPTIGGPPIWYYRVCELLLKKGYRIFSLGGKGKPPAGTVDLNSNQPALPGWQRGLQLACDVVTEVWDQRKTLMPLFKDKLLHVSDFRYLISFLALIKRAYHLVPNEGGIVLSSHANMNSVFAYLLCKKHRNLKLVIRCHGGGILEFSNRRPKLVRFLLSQADYINCVSSYIADECRKMGAAVDQIQVIFSARDIPAILDNSSKENIVLFCGYLEPRKDPLTFLKAVKEIVLSSELAKTIKFVVIGDGSLKGQIMEFIQKNSLDEIVELTGWLPQEKTWEYLNKSKVLVLPSIREPSGAVLTESMAYCCYSIATNVGGIPEIVNSERGSLFEPGDSRFLAKLIEGFFEDEASFLPKISAGYEYVKNNYSFERAAVQLDEIFKKITGFSNE